MIIGFQKWLATVGFPHCFFGSVVSKFEFEYFVFSGICQNDVPHGPANVFAPHHQRRQTPPRRRHTQRARIRAHRRRRRLRCRLASV